ncbi:MAG: AAA family ATPase [Nitrospira sp.]|nr:MAG: AAA family ATPase [Nitrospira sp.]
MRNPILLSECVYELRAPKTRQGTVSGYFNDPALLYKAADELDAKVPGIYITLNPVNPALLARAKNRLQMHAKTTTSDADILRREWLLIDCDAVRPAEISSSEPEHHAAIERAQTAASWLTEQGWPEPVLADSGNGAHLLYRIELPNDPPSRELVKSVLEVLALKFNDTVVTIDTGVFNAARITKLYGTLACKGDSTEDRPHRRSQILSVPQNVQVVSHGLLTALAALRPVEPKPALSRSNGASLDVREFLTRHGLAIVREKLWNRGVVFELESCPFNPEHVRSSSIIQFPTGAVVFTCFHNSCQGKRWAELRALLEPDHRSWRNEQGRATDSVETQAVPIVTVLSDVTREAVAYLWSGRIAVGKLTLLVGPPGVGKSYTTLDMAAHGSQGRAWPDGMPCPFFSTVLLSAEDGLADTIRARLDALDADCSKVHALTSIREPNGERSVDLSRDLGHVETVIRQTKAGLFVVDPLTAYLGRTDAHKEAEVRALLAPFADLAARERVAVVAVMHLNKSQSAGLLNRTIGSIGFVAAARAVFGIGRDPSDEARCLLVPIKSNVAAFPPILAFRLNQHGVCWEQDAVKGVSPESVFCAPAPESADEKEGREDAMAFLMELLSDGPAPAEKVFTEGRKVGLSPSQLRRASRAVHIVTRKAGFSKGWVWSLPPQDDDACHLRDEKPRNAALDVASAEDDTSRQNVIFETSSSTLFEDDAPPKMTPKHAACHLRDIFDNNNDLRTKMTPKHAEEVLDDVS